MSRVSEKFFDFAQDLRDKFPRFVIFFEVALGFSSIDRTIDFYTSPHGYLQGINATGFIAPPWSWVWVLGLSGIITVIGSVTKTTLLTIIGHIVQICMYFILAWQYTWLYFNITERWGIRGIGDMLTLMAAHAVFLSFQGILLRRKHIHEETGVNSAEEYVQLILAKNEV